MSLIGATVGVSDHGGWAMLVTVGPSGTVLDRCKVDLKDAALPGLPHHSDGRRLKLSQAVALVERVRLSAILHSRRALEVLEGGLGCGFACIALRAIPTLPESVAERIADPWANARADGVMFREVLAEAARARGWDVYWFDKRRLNDVLRSAQFVDAEADASRRFAAPWNQDCRLALAGATAALLAKE